MPASRTTRASHQPESEEALKRPAPESDQTPNADAAEQPAVPDLTGGPVAPEAWLALQQSIGNSAVGSLVERHRAGQALPGGVRHDMENAFSQNFGDVQIHSGPEVDQAAQALRAGAFTVGNNIYIDSDLSDFENPVGRQVLGEELAHVAQGAGRAGASRVTSPEETAERQAHRSGVAAAVGQPTRVSAAPEVAGALARFSLEEMEEKARKALGVDPEATAADESKRGAPAEADKSAEAAAAAAEMSAPKTDLSDEEKDRLKAGGLDPLELLLAELVLKQTEASNGVPSAAQLLSITDSAVGIHTFIYSFAGPTAIQASLESAAVSAASGRNALLAAARPKQTLAETAAMIEGTSADIAALAVAAPAPAPAPAAPAAGETATAETLTPAEADQLTLGAVDPLKMVSEQLKGDHPDMGLIISRLKSIPALLRSFSQPAHLVPQLHRKAMAVETEIRTLEAIEGGAKAAIAEAMGTWQSAIITLLGLTEHSGGGSGGATLSGPPPTTGSGGGTKVDTKAGGI